MKTTLTVLLLTVCFIANSQVLQKLNAYGYEWKRGQFDTSFAIPGDTLPLTAAQKPYPHLAGIGDNFYYWSPAAQAWVLIGGGSGGSYTNGYGLNLNTGTFSVDTSSIAYKSWTDARYIKFSDSAAMLSGYTRLAVFLDSLAALRSRVTGSYQRSLTFTNGLYKLNDSTVAANNDNAFWNAYKIQNIPVNLGTPANGSLLKFDSLTQKIIWGSPSTVSETDPIYVADSSSKTWDYAKVTGKPTIPAQFNPIAGTGISLSGSYPNITFNSTGSSGITSLNGLTGTTQTFTTGTGINITSTGTAHTFKVDTNSIATRLLVQHRIDSLGAASVNLYNANGTISADRVVTVGEPSSLTFQQSDGQIHMYPGNINMGFTSGGFRGFQVINSNGSATTTMNSGSRVSSVDVYIDSISVKPYLGNFFIDSLTEAAGTKTLRYNPSTGRVSYHDIPSGGGGGTPGGATTQVQFNDAGAFGGDADFIWDKVNNRLGVGSPNPNHALEVAGSIATIGGSKMLLGVDDSGGSGLWRIGNNMYIVLRSNIHWNMLENSIMIAKSEGKYGWAATSDANVSTPEVHLERIGPGKVGVKASASDGDFQSKSLTLTEQTAPSTPAAGYGVVYPKSDGKLYYKNSAGTEVDLTKPTLSKTITLSTPTATDNFVIFFTPVAITITKVADVVSGTSPSLTYDIHYGTDRSAAGTEVFSTDRVLTSTAGTTTTTFTNTSVPANSFIWFKSSAISGTVNASSITIIYTEN